MTEAPRYRFLVYAPQNAGDLGSEMGRADYSYFFVMRYFAAALAPVGPVVELADPRERPPALAGHADVRLLFLPPHAVPADLPGPAIPVFAWEYDTIPTDAWGGEPRNDWRVVLRQCPGAITHSEFAVAAVRRALGEDFPVVSLPAPAWDRHAALFDPDRAAVAPPWTLAVTGVVLDSRELAGPDGELVDPEPVTARRQQVSLGGVVYTSVVNPDDGRKNWADTLTAFVWAFRDEPDATLVLKLVHFDAALACHLVLAYLTKLAPFACRVVVIHAFLATPDFERLIRDSTYVVNSARGEGQCLPLMEFMSAGVPALAPDHTAMAQYVHPGAGFAIGWSQEWTHWPHDPRRFLRCLTYWPDWDELRQAFADSFALARTDPAAYQAMRREAVASLRRYCSADVVRAGLLAFLDALPDGALTGPAAAPAGTGPAGLPAGTGAEPLARPGDRVRPDRSAPGGAITTWHRASGRVTANPTLRPMPYFVHVPKTAGSTVNAYLRAWSANGFDHCESIVAEPGEWERRFREADWMSGHEQLNQVLNRAFQVPGRDLRLYTCVREPTEQLRSHLNWLIEIHRRPAGYDTHPQRAREISEFVRSAPITPQRVRETFERFPMLFHNMQARLVLGPGAWSDKDLRERLRRYDTVVTNEHVPALVEAITGRLAPAQPLRANRATYHFDRAVFADPGLLAFLHEYNRLDYRLYDAVRDRA